MINEKHLEEVLIDWNYWQKPPPVSIPRSILQRPIHLEPDLVLVIQGVRRCGKSTLLAQMVTTLQLDFQNCFFINFEDPRLSGHLDHTLLDAIVTFAQNQRNGRNLVFFFDEIQNVSNWQKWLHQKLERPGKNSFVITGSNAALLSGELASALTGRHLTLELFPFDFHEYQKAKPEMSFSDYLQDGGFPRTLNYDEPEKLLREYFSDIIERDVRSHVSARSTLLLTQLVKTVFESAGSELSLRNLAKILGITADTIKTYLDACEAAYLILPCPYFTFSERQRLVRNKKYYPIDLGLRKAVITKTGMDYGKDLETVVFHRLRKKYKDVFYWRQKKEVDFVVQDGREILGFHVSWNGEKERHKQAAEEFHAAFPKAKDIEMITRETVLDFIK